MISPFSLYFHFNRLSIKRLALDPELTMIACGEPNFSANSCSNCFTCLPMVYMSVSTTRCIASSSSSPHVENANGYFGPTFFSGNIFVAFLNSVSAIFCTIPNVMMFSSLLLDVLKICSMVMLALDPLDQLLRGISSGPSVCSL